MHRPRDRRPRPVDHLVLGQRPRHHLPRAAARRWPRAATRHLPRARRALVRASTATCRRPPTCRIALYADLAELQRPLRARRSRTADVVIVGSYVPDGVAVARWVRRRAARRHRLLRHRHAGHARQARARRARVPVARARSRGFDLYLSFTGGPSLARLEQRVRRARARARSTARSIPELYRPLRLPRALATSAISAPTAPTASRRSERLLLEPARALAAGSGSWSPGRSIRPTSPGPPTSSASSTCRPSGTARSTASCASRSNVTRADMVARRLVAERAPVRGGGLRRADHQRRWPGLDELLVPGREILIARSARRGGALSARDRSGRAAADRRGGAREGAAAHTAACRAREFEAHVAEAGALARPDLAASA